MMGLVLWYNPDPGIGMVWCEDQGPLAFLGAEVRLPDGAPELRCGDLLAFDFEMLDGVRYVCRILQVVAGHGAVAPAEIIARYHRTREGDAVLNVVA